MSVDLKKVEQIKKSNYIEALVEELNVNNGERIKLARQRKGIVDSLMALCPYQIGDRFCSVGTVAGMSQKSIGGRLGWSIAVQNNNKINHRFLPYTEIAKPKEEQTWEVRF